MNKYLHIIASHQQTIAPTPADSVVDLYQPERDLTAAHSILITCQRAGVYIRIDAATGDLVVGKAHAKADEQSQPWPSLLVAIEAHLEAVVALVASGWMLRADITRGAAA